MKSKSNCSSWLGLWNPPTASLCKEVRPPTNGFHGHYIKQSDGETQDETLRSVEYPFIVISPRSTLTGVIATDKVLSMGQIA